MNHCDHLEVHTQSWSDKSIVLLLPGLDIHSRLPKIKKDQVNAQSWYIQQAHDLNIDLQSQKNYTNEYARKAISTPPDDLLYTPGTIAASRRLVPGIP